MATLSGISSVVVTETRASKVVIVIGAEVEQDSEIATAAITQAAKVGSVPESAVKQRASVTDYYGCVYCRNRKSRRYILNGRSRKNKNQLHLYYLNHIANPAQGTTSTGQH